MTLGDTVWPVTPTVRSNQAAGVRGGSGVLSEAWSSSQHWHKREEERAECVVSSLRLLSC